MAKSKKAFTREEILKAIYQKFTTLEDLGKSLKLKQSKQNISAKINRQSPKFLKQLRDVGIVLGQDKYGLDLIDSLKDQVIMLKEKLIEKDKIISELKKKYHVR